jgi:hypothetical protein
VRAGGCGRGCGCWWMWMWAGRGGGARATLTAAPAASTAAAAAGRVGPGPRHLHRPGHAATRALRAGHQRDGGDPDAEGCAGPAGAAARAAGGPSAGSESASESTWPGKPCPGRPAAHPGPGRRRIRLSLRSMGLTSSGYPLAGPGGPTEPLYHWRLRMTGSGLHALRRNAGRWTRLGLRDLRGPRTPARPWKVPPAAGPDWAREPWAVRGQSSTWEQTC